MYKIVNRTCLVLIVLLNAHQVAFCAEFKPVIGWDSVTRNTVDVNSTFEFKAHDPIAPLPNPITIPGVLSFANTPLVVHHKFKDKHASIGSGTIEYVIKEGAGQGDGKKHYDVGYFPKSTVNPACPDGSNDCGPVQMVTIAKVTRALTNIARGDIAEKTMLSLAKGTTLQSSESAILSEAFIDDNGTSILYELAIGVIEDPITHIQQIFADFTPGSDTDEYSLTFGLSTPQIEAAVMDAFAYHPSKQEWTVDLNATLFELTIADLKGGLNGLTQNSATLSSGPRTEVPVSDSGSAFGALVISLITLTCARGALCSPCLQTG